MILVSYVNFIKVIKHQTLPNKILGLILDRTTYKIHVNLSCTQDDNHQPHKMILAHPGQSITTKRS